jgi:HNH endonuclease
MLNKKKGDLTFMPSGGKPTILVCENCKHTFKKKHHGKITNRWCCRRCRDEFLAKEKVASGIYSRNTAISYFRRFTKYACSCCNISEWQGRPLTLQVDHVDGNNRNNRIENLRYLCPNCHTQTDTWGTKNASIEGKRRIKEGSLLGIAIRQGKAPIGSKL